MSLLLTTLVVAASGVHAEPVTSANVTAELLSEQETIQPGKPFTVGIALRPSPDWHTYWQNPGDSGLPTRVTWKLPEGFRAGDLEFPAPVRLGKAPFVTYGYESDSLLLARIEAPASLSAGSNAEIVAETRWLSCREDACIPGRADLRLSVRVEKSAPHRDSRWDRMFDAWRARIPGRIDGWSATVTQNDKTIRVEVAAPKRRPSTTDIEVFPMAANVIDASAQPDIEATDTGFTIEVARDEKAAPVPDSLGLVLLAREGWDADGSMQALRVDAKRIGAPPAADTAPAGAAPAADIAPAGAAEKHDEAADAPPAQPIAPPEMMEGLTLWAALGLAFLGGVLLNLMPCVFPVLSLKILGFVHVAHHQPAVVRRHGYAYAAGVLASFWFLAVMLLGLRAAGSYLGWGFQLQEPLFVAALAGLLLAMSLNLMGVFEIGESITTTVGQLDSAPGYRGSFLSGVLATVLATPCSAPFMGTAIGFALVQQPVDAIAIFTSLGAGMASPYLLLASVPMLLRRLPKPGRWMVIFREAMAFPMLATVVWLVWVFGQQTGNDGVMRLLMALLIGAMGVWIGGRFPAGAAARIVTSVCFVAATLIAVSASSRSGMPGEAAEIAAGGGVKWVAWDPEAVAQHRGEGRVVFVDFTADWCLSCKVNERVALAGEDFADLMREHEAVAMKADWTRADPRITQALATFGRSGVPLYVIYPGDPTREPIVLPQILTPDIVRGALERAVT